MSRPVDVRTGLPVARYGDVNQPWVDRRQRLVVDAEALDDAWPVVLQEHVGALDEIEQQGLSVRRFQVDGEGPLVAVKREERDVDAVAARAAGGDVALPLACDRFDLDDVGTEIAEALRRKGPGHGDGTIENPVSAENAHFRLS